MPTVNSPKEIAEAGERIYRDKYKQEYEKSYPGQFAAINIKTGAAVVRPAAEAAAIAAREASPDGVFHLIKIGSPGAFQLGFAHSNGSQNWLLG